jgi:hypothetical protein
VRQGDHHVARRSAGDVVDENAEAPVISLRCGSAGRLQEAQVGNAVLRAQVTLGLEDGPDLEDFLGGCQPEG